MLPCIAGLPSLVSGFTRARDGVEPPGLATGAYVVSGDESANPEFAASHTDNNLVLHDERCNRHSVPGIRIAHFRIPEWPAGFRIQRNEMCVERCKEQRVSE